MPYKKGLIKPARFHHLGLFTNQPRRILNFYEKQLGFKRISKMRLSRDIVKTIFGISCSCFMMRLVFKNFNLEIFWLIGTKLKKRPVNCTGFNHFAIVVKDKVAFCNGLNKNFGVRVIRAYRDNHFVYFIQDPDRNLIEVMELN